MGVYLRVCPPGGRDLGAPRILLAARGRRGLVTEDSQHRASPPAPPQGSSARTQGGGRVRETGDIWRVHGTLWPSYTCMYSRLHLSFIFKPHFEIVLKEAAEIMQGPVHPSPTFRQWRHLPYQAGDQETGVGPPCVQRSLCAWPLRGL